MMKRRQFLRTAASLGGAALLSACGASSPASPPLQLAKDKPTFVFFFTPG
jgi:hypothetical protein